MLIMVGSILGEGGCQPGALLQGCTPTYRCRPPHTDVWGFQAPACLLLPVWRVDEEQRQGGHPPTSPVPPLQCKGRMKGRGCPQDSESLGSPPPQSAHRCNHAFHKKGVGAVNALPRIWKVGEFHLQGQCQHQAPSSIHLLCSSNSSRAQA